VITIDVAIANAYDALGAAERNLAAAADALRAATEALELGGAAVTYARGQLREIVE